MNDSPAIEADSLSKTYSDGLIFRKRFEALKDVSFEVNRGEIFGLLGPNGAGKTTFLKILLGIIRKSAGSATMLGYAAGSRQGRQLVGYLPEHLRIPPHMTAYTALECFGNLSNVPNTLIREKRDHLLELVGLADRARDRVKKFSKGMLQRLGLAQSLLHDPQLLVLDEPTDGLDPRARADMREIIRKLQERGVTIFLNSHLLQEVELVCDRVAILDRGMLRYSGSVSEINEFVNQLIGKQGQGMLVDFEVAGDPDSVNRGFTESKFEIREAVDGQFTVRVSLPNQNAIDALVDRLRGEGVSLIGLNRQTLSLEDAFLQIVQEESI